MSIEILTFQGCPHRAPAIALVEQVLAETGVVATAEVIDVADPQEAQALRFLGSPTVRVDGRDVEPGADERTEFSLACRVYRTDAGYGGLPDPRWLERALLAAESDR